MNRTDDRLSEYRLLLLVSGALFSSFAHADTAPAAALAEVQYLNEVFGVPIKWIDATAGTRSFNAGDSLTSDALQTLPIQYSPPMLGAVPDYPSSQQDDVAGPPYISTGLQNFRFDYFHNTYNFGGLHTWASADYATVHGFDVLTNYARNTSEVTWLPADTHWMTWFGYVDWAPFMTQLGLPAGRWDQLMDLGQGTIVQAILDANAFAGADPGKVDELMIDMEHTALDPTTLRQQSWYPGAASTADKAAFEKKYYDGFVLTQTAPILAARQLGFQKISLYGWKPVNAGWFGLETYTANPATDWYWQNVGVQVLPYVDSVNNSVYCYYWSAQNVAYTLAQNDLNLKYIRSVPLAQQRPLRPYFWNQLQGGGGGWRWWQGQSLPSEEMRAITLLNAFTQYDGMVLWNFSGTDNPNLPPQIAASADVMLKDATFTAGREGGGSRTFMRYDALHVTDVDGSGNVRFQLIDKTNWGNNMGVGPPFPYYDSTVEELAPHLRAPSESLAAMFEGLAMAQLLEWNLRHGTAVAEFDSQQLYATSQPVLRHIRNGDLHLIATYDPQVIYGQPARTVALNNFDGVSGLRLTFTADASVRVYIIRLH